MKNNDQRSSIFWFAVGLAIIFFSRKYGLGTLSVPGPGFLPFLAGVAITGLAILVFFQQYAGNVRGTFSALWAKTHWPKVLMVMGALVLYTLLFRIFGFLLDTFLLIAFLLRVMEPTPWVKCLIGALLFSGASYLIFELWLKAQLPTGFLGF
ncbi:MAG: tripartite tricarboxylate transporter TctB family protein [Thermodesulfobacteriota bacterium]